jgi:hypothetical protein
MTEKSRHLLEDAGLSCPRCLQQPLGRITVESLGAHHCAACRGLLVDWQTINAVTDRCSAQPPEDGAGRGRGAQGAEALCSALEGPAQAIELLHVLGLFGLF